MSTIPPLLVCLDLERDFANPDSVNFIPGQERALRACELILTHARRERWRIAHCFRLPRCEICDVRPIRGFEPIAGEMVFRRAALSPYAAQPFEREMAYASHVPAFLIGFGSAQQIMATIFDAIARNHTMTAILEAIHTPPAGGIDHERLNEAAQTLLRGLSSAFSTADLKKPRPALPPASPFEGAVAGANS